jgi:peroxidase
MSSLYNHNKSFRCPHFVENLNKAKEIVKVQKLHADILYDNGFVLKEGDIGFHRYSKQKKNKNIKPASTDEYIFNPAWLFTETARIFADENDSALDSFEDFSTCLYKNHSKLTSRPKYRPIDGFGNNLKNPYWGATGSPFGRFLPKNYNDGVYSIRKSVTGADLPSPRELTQKVLRYAEKGTPPKVPLNMMTILLVLYITHDLAHQVPVNSVNPSEETNCCSHRNRFVLPQSLSHGACLPISVGEEDEFYSKGKIRCINMVRSQLGVLPKKVQYGEIQNHATGFMDHSMIYGVSEVETRRIRMFQGGEIRLSERNVMPVDENGNMINNRIAVSSITVAWPGLFARNHNYLAKGLAAVNPTWRDETIFQEARRINIGLFQAMIFSTATLEKIFGHKVNETYNENRNPATSVEFNTGAYRFGHYFLQPEMLIIDKSMKTTKMNISDTVGRTDLALSKFDDILRGVMQQPMNYGPYTDEIYNKIEKNAQGFGEDLLSIDIQRGKIVLNRV